MEREEVDDNETDEEEGLSSTPEKNQILKMREIATLMKKLLKAPRRSYLHTRIYDVGCMKE